MAADFHNRVAGLIAIEPQPLDAQAGSSGDATLGELLLGLAIDSARPLTVMPVARHRFGAARTRAWLEPARLSANLKNLTAELELAVAQVRRRIAAETLAAE